VGQGRTAGSTFDKGDLQGDRFATVFGARGFDHTEVDPGIQD
jgi:hypothetical protein